MSGDDDWTNVTGMDLLSSSSGTSSEQMNGHDGYRSPLMDIVDELRRKHAASAVATSQVTASSFLSTDASMSPRKSTSNRRQYLQTIQNRRHSQPPRHAKALLRRTPHLRHLSPASTDLQGIGNTGPVGTRGMLGFLGGIFPHPGDDHSTGTHILLDYRTSQQQWKAHQQAARELRDLVTTLAHEMTLDEFGREAESFVFGKVFSLFSSSRVQSNSTTTMSHHDHAHRMAAVAALDALLDAPSADDEKKAIQFANKLSASLRASGSDYEFLSAITLALGHMAQRATNVDFVESEITRALEWLQTQRSDRRLAACLTLTQLAIHAPTAFRLHTTASNNPLYVSSSGGAATGGSSNEFLDQILDVLADPQPIVRACAADALGQCLKILVERQSSSLTAVLCQVHFGMMDALEQEPEQQQAPQENQTQRRRITVKQIAQMEAAQHGGLLVVADMLEYTHSFMLPRLEEVCNAVLAFCPHPKALIRLEVIRLIPRLAKRCPEVFGRRYLEDALLFLISAASGGDEVVVPASANSAAGLSSIGNTLKTTHHHHPHSGIDLRPSAFASIGHLILAMRDGHRVIGGEASPTIRIRQTVPYERSTSALSISVSKTGIIYNKLPHLFELIQLALTKKNSATLAATRHATALHCAADLVEALGPVAEAYLPSLMSDMFKSGLSEDLISCLHSIAASLPSQQRVVEGLLLQEVSTCLAGTPLAVAICDPLSDFHLPQKDGRPVTVYAHHGGWISSSPDESRPTTEQIPIKDAQVRINFSEKPDVVIKLVLSLRTLASFGDEKGMVMADGLAVPVLLFVRDVATKYLRHGSSEVRREATSTCCTLLIPRELAESSVGPDGNLASYESRHGTIKRRLGVYSGRLVEEGLSKLLQVAVSDVSPVVRLSVVRALDERYDYFLCQAHHLQPLFFLLQDEVLATRAAGLHLLGRLTRLNPAPILPIMRKFLRDLISELKCGSESGRSREESTRLLVCFIKAEPLRRLVRPMVSSIVEALPLEGVAPRLASIALEALGEVAVAAPQELRPWIPSMIPFIVKTMQDQSSANKQRTSLRTLGQIAASTGYVIRPYMDFPELLPTAADVLPGTKRAPWELRREVIRTLGTLGAFDPDAYHRAVPRSARTGGAVGGGYFVERDTQKPLMESVTQKDALLPKSMKEDAGVSIEPSTQTDPRSRALSMTTTSRFSPPANETPVDSHASEKDGDDDLPAHLFMYEQYAMVAQPVSRVIPPRRLTPADEDFYPTVAIQALTRIFKDQSLSVHHGMVMQAIMFIFNSLGQRCVPFLPKVVPHMLHAIKTCGPSNLREALLKQLATLSGIVREHLRPYVADIFDIVDDYWNSRHLGTILGLVSRIAVGVPDNFQGFLPRLVRKLLASLEEVQKSVSHTHEGHVPSSEEMDKLDLVLRSIRNLRGVLSEYKHILIPSMLHLAKSLINSPKPSNRSSSTATENLPILTVQVLTNLLEHERTRALSRVTPFSFGQISTESLPPGCELASRTALPLIKLLSDATSSRRVGFAIVDSICLCVRVMGPRRWKLYHDVSRRAIKNWEDAVGLTTERESTEMTPNPRNEPRATVMNGLALYDTVAGFSASMVHGRDGLLHRESFALNRRASEGNIDAVAAYELAVDTTQDFQDTPAFAPVLTERSRYRLNPLNLERSWDVSNRASREDWDEWMRRFGIQLLREAPSPSLRATASLAHAFQPLARELFSAAFVCCWEELGDQHRTNLVHALETAFVADVSPEILQTLLNLAEFMEHDGVSSGLPIDISNLAELALKCRAYAKALHYKEREFIAGGANANNCVESLISINKKLDLPEAALGVLKATRMEASLGIGEVGMPEYDGRSLVRNDQHEAMKYSVIFATGQGKQESGSWIPMRGLEEVHESWLAKLGSWADALAVYERKLFNDPTDFDATLGCMRCLDASGEWSRVLDLARQSWTRIHGGNGMHEYMGRSFDSLYLGPKQKRKALKFASQAAWRLRQWDDLERFAKELLSLGNQTAAMKGSEATKTDFDGSFFLAVLRIHQHDWDLAEQAIDTARKAMDSRFTALMAESFKRAYPSMVNAQILSEMEEIIAYRKLEERAAASIQRHPVNRPNQFEARERLLTTWRERLKGCRVDAEVHSDILAVRSLVLGPTDEIEATLALSDLSREAARFKLAERVVLDPLAGLGADLNGPIFGLAVPESLGLNMPTLDETSHANVLIDTLITRNGNEIGPQYYALHSQYTQQMIQEVGGKERLSIQHKLCFAFIKHLWAIDSRSEAIERLERLSVLVDMVSVCGGGPSDLRVQCWLELGEFKLQQSVSPAANLSYPLQVQVLSAFKKAVSAPSCGYHAWHAWALFNFRLAELRNETSEGGTVKTRNQKSSDLLRKHVLASIEGFVQAISLGRKRWSASVQQDLLNLLSCLFKYGDLQDVPKAINEGTMTIMEEAWLGVLPQLLARIHIRHPGIRSVLHPLLTRLGEKHPQALMYPLSVLLKSPVDERKLASASLMNTLKSHSSSLVEEALMVSSELIRVAILWLETWHEGLEDASRLYFGEGNVSGMLDILLPLHQKLESGAETQKELEFFQSFGQNLAEAHGHVKDYIRLTGDESGIPGDKPSKSGPPSGQSEAAETAMNKAWDIYYTVFRFINKQLPALTKLELSQCSPALSQARSLELGIPGSYRVDGSYVPIRKFIQRVDVITSKQRPRKITLQGEDGKDYTFLLKGHEDLRQDERVMQLFGLVNALLARDRQTKKHDLSIKRYTISPLSHNCGVVGWVPHCDTLHSLIRDYRQSKKIALNTENREMLKITPDYDLCTTMQKVCVFEEALRKTVGNGNDLREILIHKSTNSEEWLERRTKYTRSLAVMSIVGYILGLGDRHPSNLMVDQLSGRILHIDFGDCFEVAQQRDKYPEKVPFRLTRMLVRAMEVSGIEGSYRTTCERTMAVLRDSRDSLVAMLEAFVYDPLISWRLVGLSENTEKAEEKDEEKIGVLETQPPKIANEVNEEEVGIEMEGAPIDVSLSVLHESIAEFGEDDDDREEEALAVASNHLPLPEEEIELENTAPTLGMEAPPRPRHTPIGEKGMSLTERIKVGTLVENEAVKRAESAVSVGRARSLQMYSEIQSMAANLSASSRIASVAAEDGTSVAAKDSLARSRMARSLRQKEVMSLLQQTLDGETAGQAHEAALNEKALRVIRRVQDKLSGTDFADTFGEGETAEPLDVPDQVHRLIVQATSTENLCQLFIGWCAFW